MAVATFLIMSFLFSISSAEHNGSFAIQAEVGIAEYESNLSMMPSGTPVEAPRVKVGVRWSIVKKLDLDALFGVATISWVEGDTASQTEERPGSKSVLAEVGLAYKILAGDDAALRILGRFGTRFNQWFEYLETYWPYYWWNRFVRYNVTIPALSVGFEPSYSFSQNFSVFSRFGMSLVFIPDSKRIDYGSPEYDPDANVFPLVKRNDSRTEIKTDAITMGLRFHF